MFSQILTDVQQRFPVAYMIVQDLSMRFLTLKNSRAPIPTVVLCMGYRKAAGRYFNMLDAFVNFQAVKIVILRCFS